MTRQLVESVRDQTLFTEMRILITEFQQKVWNPTHSPWYGGVHRTYDTGNRHPVTPPPPPVKGCKLFSLSRTRHCDLKNWV